MGYRLPELDLRLRSSAVATGLMDVLSVLYQNLLVI